MDVEPAGYELVEDDARFAEVVRALLAAPRYALDTEFHRERTYFPRLAVVQLAWGDEVVVVDALSVDIGPLRAVLEGPAVAVLHAADQDLEVLETACGNLPGSLFDTQIAAGFVGMSTPSLSAVHERLLGLRLPKGDRLTDWLRRPLTPGQLSYAASDVAHLLEVHDLLTADLTSRGRLQWALDECENLRRRSRGARDPDQAWRRIKEARQLRGRARLVAQSVAGWRERRAAEVDQPVRHILPDLAIVSIAQHPPRSLKELRRLRGLDERHVRDATARQVLDAVAAGLERPEPVDDAPPTRELERELRPAVGLVSAWVSQLARDLEIDTTLLATRSDLEALLRGDPDARLAQGWRADLVGEPIRKLVSGDAALAFNQDGTLALEARSHQPLS